MIVHAIPARYKGVMEAGIRQLVRDIEKDMAEPHARPRQVPAFAIDERLTGDVLVVVTEVRGQEEQAQIVGAIAQVA